MNEFLMFKDGQSDSFSHRFPNMEKHENPLDETEVLNFLSKRKDNEEIQGYASIAIDHVSNKLLANGKDNTLYLYNLEKIHSEPPMIFKGHKTNFYTK